MGNYGAFIYVSSASATEITFQVTINDPQYSFMGVDTVSGRIAGGLYAVRFTDGEGRLLHTAYDDNVYTMSELKKEFVLNDTTILNDDKGFTVNSQIEAQTTYCLNIYTVPDHDHDGRILLDGETEASSWERFYNKLKTTLSDCGQGLLDIVNGFWNTNTSNCVEADGMESQLLVARKEQSTTTVDNWLLNQNNCYATRYNATTVRIVFEESFGLINGSEPHFKQIDWAVDGRKADGSPVSASGTLKYSDGDALLKSGRDTGGYDIYHLDIPYDVGQGNYTIILQFREVEGAAAATRTITLRSGV